MTNAQNAARERRTTTLLAQFRGNRDEFMMLKGVLCAQDSGECPEDDAYLYLAFNNIRIAERMDQMNAETLAEVMRSASATAYASLNSKAQTNANPGA